MANKSTCAGQEFGLKLADRAMVVDPAEKIRAASVVYSRRFGRLADKLEAQRQFKAAAKAAFEAKTGIAV
jgi:hypothetical protein